MGQPSLVDPQFGPYTILRPYSGFETEYEGEAGNTPIPFAEYVNGAASEALDPQAGQPGYSGVLLRGVPVPFGARVQIALPSVLNTQVSGYSWQIVWRLRNNASAWAQEGQGGFHFPKQANGITETTVPPAARFIIPALYETILFPGSEPGTANGRATGTLRIENISPRADNLPLPFLPGGARGYYEQGVLDPATTEPWATQQGLPSYNSFFTNAKGNELLLGLYRAALPNWTFATTDKLVASMFGASSPVNLGVYVAFGSAP